MFEELKSWPFLPDIKELLRPSPADFVIITTGIEIFASLLLEQTISKRSGKINSWYYTKYDHIKLYRPEQKKENIASH